MTLILGHLLHKLQDGKGNHLSRDDRDFLASLVEAQCKQPAHRPASESVLERRNSVALTVLKYQHQHRCKLEAGVEEAKRVHKVSREYVFRALRAFRERTIGFEVWNVAGVERRFVSRDGMRWEVQTPNPQWQAAKSPDGRWEVVPYLGGQWPEVD